MATSRFTRVAAVIAVTPLLQELTDALRQGRRLSAISSRDGAMITAGPLPHGPGNDHRYAVASGEEASGRLRILSSARSAAASFLDEVGVAEAALSLTDPERQVATSGQ